MVTGCASCPGLFQSIKWEIIHKGYHFLKLNFCIFTKFMNLVLVKLFQSTYYKEKTRQNKLTETAPDPLSFHAPRRQSLALTILVSVSEFQIACYWCFPAGLYQLTSHLEDEDLPVFSTDIHHSYTHKYFISLFFKLVTSAFWLGHYSEYALFKCCHSSVIHINI